MEHRKKILVFVDWYLPGYKAGGQIRTVANMVAYMKDEFDFWIVTSDTDLNEAAPYQSVISDQWTKGPDGTNVIYLSRGNQNYKTIKSIILEARADVIYLNSLFSKAFTLYPLMVRKRHLPVRKLVLAPRGMLGEGALKIKSAKKKAFLFWARLTGLYQNVRWHASTENENAEIRRQFKRAENITVALDLSEPREIKFYPRVKKTGEMKLVFLSRISPKKNLELALRLLKSLPSSYTVSFDIFGPVEEAEHWKICEDLIASMPSHIKAEYKGFIPNSEVTQTLSNYHLSILLTFNENFGHSIIESMVAGCPVLLSDQTPWRGLEKIKAGWDIPLKEENRIVKALEYAIKMNQLEFDEWSRNASEYARKVIFNPHDIEQNRKLFR
jgi:glycosyltransferase involved in cell wall biosynthesis